MALRREPITLLLAGDVMLGRGLDQIFPVSCSTDLHQPFKATALTYVELAEKAHGLIPRSVRPSYVWGDGLDAIERMRPDARIVNLETAVTPRGEHDTSKWIHYRMHPENLACLSAAGVDCLALANNHVLDWSTEGLRDTLAALEAAGIAMAGAGLDEASAWKPVALDLAGGGRLLFISFGFPDSGIPSHWAAGPGPGVAFLPDFSDASAATVASAVDAHRRTGDVVVASVHWGGNWGYAVPQEHRRFARRLVERVGVDLIHGHSSHHPRPLEVHEGRLVLYGCGDLLNDYEGVRLHRRYRGDLVLLYFPRIDPATRHLIDLAMIPFRIRRFRLECPPEEDVEWLRATLDRECGRYGARITGDASGRILLG